MKGKWMYLYRALDSCGATIDFLLSAKRDSATAQRFLTKAVRGENHPEPRGLPYLKPRARSGRQL
jgi:transposase-like protein